MTGLFINTIATFALVVSFIIVFRRLSARLELIDCPDAVRKQHRGRIPLCGGIAIMLAFALTSFFSHSVQDLGAPFWVALFLVTSLGVADDRHPLPAVVRLAVQIAVSVSLVRTLDIGMLSTGIPLLKPEMELLPLLSVVGTLFVVGLMNAWNMLDGVDGLAGGAAAVALIWLMLVVASTSSMDISDPLGTLLVCLCGFLVFNMRSPLRVRASIFLGDAGSMSLGLIAAYVILVLATDATPVSFTSLLWIVVVPVTDTLSLIIRRVLAHRSPMSADRWHLHHLLIDHGFTPSSTTSTILILSAVCGGVGYTGIRLTIPDEIMALGLVIFVGLHTVFVLVATGRWKRTRIYNIGPAFRAKRAKVVNGASSNTLFEGSGNADVQR